MAWPPAPSISSGSAGIEPRPGLSIDPSEIDAFSEAFAAHADAALTDDDLRPRTVVDAVVTGRELTLDLCEELRRLAPFGLANPGVTLLLPSCELGDLAAVGDGKHLRFRVRDRGRDAGSAIAFGLGTQLDRFRAGGALRRRLPARGEPVERHGRAAARRAPRARRAASATRACATGSPASGAAKPGSARRTPQAIFAELGLDGETAIKTSLLESEAFRALLEEPELARAA